MEYAGSRALRASIIRRAIRSNCGSPISPLEACSGRLISCHGDLLPILEAPDPRLRVISTPAKTIDDGLGKLIEDMFEQMHDAPGIGLAV